MAHIYPSFLHLVQNALDGNAFVLMNIGLALVAVAASLRSTWTVLYNYAEKTCLTSVHVNEEDPLYSDIILWMNDHIFRHHHFRSITAVTTSDDKSSLNRDAAKLFNNTSKENPMWIPQTMGRRRPISLQPYGGSRLFRHNRKWFLFSHMAPVLSGNSSRNDNGQSLAQMKLQCLSWSLDPIRQFISECATYSSKASMSSITIHRAIPYGREIFRWTNITSRPSRDMSTVILQSGKKEKILSDIEEYLNDQTKQWYANHGIPYRRGYLFSGPPGTGKTSLASAIAGAFSLDIYVLSLLDAKISESQLIRLFSEVPSQCVVLLEDIDAAGVTLARDGVPNKGGAKSHNTQPATDSNGLNASTTSAIGISLSGLLNAIDGVSSHEGRILIMTTNAPDVLDRALIRPGRVDLHIQFDLPGREEMQGLFLSMFSDVVDEAKREGTESKHLPLEELAVQFAERLPEKRFSLAEVQGYLLQHKKRPAEACAGVTDWVMGMNDGESDGSLI